MLQVMTGWARWKARAPLPPAEDRPTRLRFRVLGFGCLLAVLSYIMRVCLGQVGPEICLSLSLTKADWGLVMASFSFAYGAFEIPGGYFSDVVGPRRTLLAAVLSFSLMTALTGLAGGLLGLIIIRFCFGMCQAAVFPNIACMLTAWLPTARRASAQGMVWMCTRIGGAIAPAAISGLVVWTESWRSALLLLALLGIVWCAGFWPWYRDDPAAAPGINAAELALLRQDRAPTRPHASVPWMRLLRSANLWALALMYGFGGFTAFFTISMLPTYLQTHLHATEFESATVVGTALLTGGAACWLSGRWSDRITRRLGSRRWGRRLFGISGFCAAGLAVLGLSLTNNLALVTLLVCTMCACYDWTVPVSWAACSDIGERYSGTVSGVMNTLGNLGAALGAMTAGRLMQREETTLLFCLFAGSYWIAALLWLRIDASAPASDLEAGD